jgi:hypothetical protein
VIETTQTGIVQKAPPVKPKEEKLTLAEEITKTQLNTGIRFNIVDDYGYDNASLVMF